ncbi:ACT domain-containing protein [Roseobacter weihaiensis]|uniref:ACT domain-containing protein n=1 Tax=Roseobacter weihaiensis TaxID=2763262 RepID=UPI001D09BD8B|nr:ACT domain-containing protein [Roseobacter sp. H9]
MSGETDLEALFRTLKISVADGIYVFTTLEHRKIPEGLEPKMVFQETEGTTLILLREEAEEHHFTYEFPSKMITLNVHSSLEAVGFMARISTALSVEGMGVNPVAGFFHDHLFVPLGRETDALRVLEELKETALNHPGAS